MAAPELSVNLPARTDGQPNPITAFRKSAGQISSDTLEVIMLDEIVRSCGNPDVAEAAVRSIGVSFAEEVQAVARTHGMSLGLYVATAVWDFTKEATPEARAALHEAIRASDQPVLHGLASILVGRLVNEQGAAVRRDRTFGGLRPAVPQVDAA